MAKKKGPKMAHPRPAREELTRELQAMVENAAEQLDEKEFEKREREADEVIESVRARVSRRERA